MRPRSAVCGPLVDIARRADLNDLALVEDRHPVGHGQRFALIVGDEHERDADFLLQRLELLLHLLAQLEIERAQRLIQEQHLGGVDEGAGQGHPLALAARKLARAAGSRIREA